MKRLVGSWAARAGTAVAAAALLASVSLGASTQAASRGHGVVTFAELPESPPNYISPLDGSVDETNANTGQFSWLMWPAVYRVGDDGKPDVNWAISVGEPPVYSDDNTVVTVTLKHWVWSNGQPITARDVVFWMNLISALSDPNIPAVGSSSAPGATYGNSVPGGFPQNVKSYQQTGTYTIVFHLNASYNPTWFTDDELSQLVPIPQASWDRLSASGPVGNYDASAEPEELLPSGPDQPCTDCYVPVDPGTASSGALGVAEFLNDQSEDLATYDSNPLWQVVSGAFRLSQFTTSGFVKMVPNSRYSGAPKPRISAFEELPYSSDSAEFDALRAGSVDIGYIPPSDLGLVKSVESSDGLRFAPWYVYGSTLSPLNLTNPTAGPIFSQLYFRRAFQYLIDQSEYIKDFSGGLGTADNGPFPPYPLHNPDLSPLVSKGSVYPYDPSKSVSLLKAHGWDVQPHGSSYCEKPGSGSGECGTGIKQGQTLDFSILYVSGQAQLTNELEAMQSTMKKVAGIDLTLKQGSLSDVLATGDADCSSANPCSDWDIVDWAATNTWTYPGALATGGQYFSPDGLDMGDWQTPENLANIKATETAPNQKAEIQALYRYEDYVAEQVPMMMMPNGPYQLTMYSDKLDGLVPQGIFADINPQYYALAK